ncbi:hypothetical protein [Erythrobacter westpacificensis]
MGNRSGTASIYNEFNIAGGTLTPRLDFSFSSRVFYEVNNRISQPAYGVFNASVNYTTDDDRWSFTIGGRNLSDELYFVSSDARNVPTDIGYTIVSYARPREFYGTVAFRF